MKINKKKIFNLILIIACGFILYYGLVLSLGSTLASLIYNGILYGKYNTLFISELVLLIFSLIILLLRKKINILIKHRMGFLKSIKKGMPLIIISLLILLSNIYDLSSQNIDILNLVSLIFLAITIGLAEEFLFRGWLQNEIVDSYKDNRRQIIMSIIISGVLFGLVHLINAFSGQDIFTTIMQVIQTSAIGILLGSIYYISKNIWSVVALHSIYDFVILLGEVNSYKDCVNNPNISVAMNIFTIIITICYSVIYLIGAYFILQKSNVYKITKEEITEEIIKKDEYNKNYAKKLIIVTVIIMLLSSMFIPIEDANNIQICYEYEEITYTEGEINYSKNKEFILDNYKFYEKNEKLNIDDLINNKTYIINIKDVYNIYVYKNINNYVIILNCIDKIYYLESNLIEVNFDTLDELFIEFVTPEIKKLGYFEVNNTKYPLLTSVIEDNFIIKDKKIMVMK